MRPPVRAVELKVAAPQILRKKATNLNPRVRLHWLAPEETITPHQSYYRPNWRSIATSIFAQPPAPAEDMR
jgi:hypothetical protein